MELKDDYTVMVSAYGNMGDTPPNMELFAEKLGQLSAVESTSYQLYGSRLMGECEYQGAEVKEFNRGTVHANYREHYGVKLLAGRHIDTSLRSNAFPIRQQPEQTPLSDG